MKDKHTPHTNHNTTLSVVLATFNEQSNIAACLDSIKSIADEIVIFDENSTDKTREIAKRYKARVFKCKHNDNFHITKQKAIDKATGEWILQLDADERVSKRLAEEIVSVTQGKHGNFLKGTLDKREYGKKHRLFQRHLRILEQRDGIAYREMDQPDAYFVPRVNYFLGAPLIHAGVYPDGVIRLFRNGKAHLPAKSVHELMSVDGSVGWLYNDLEHHDTPTLKRYFTRMNRYTDIQSTEIKSKYKSQNGIVIAFNFLILKPYTTFLNLYFRHHGILDGYRGFLWSLFSAWHFPVAYFKYLSLNNN